MHPSAAIYPVTSLAVTVACMHCPTPWFNIGHSGCGVRGAVLQYYNHNGVPVHGIHTDNGRCSGGSHRIAYFPISHGQAEAAVCAVLYPGRQPRNSHLCYKATRACGPLTDGLSGLRACAQVKAALCAALYPNAAVMDESGGAGRPAWNDGTADVYIHPSSALHALEAAQFARPYLVYLEKVLPEAEGCSWCSQRVS